VAQSHGYIFGGKSSNPHTRTLMHEVSVMNIQHMYMYMYSVLLCSSYSKGTHTAYRNGYYFSRNTCNSLMECSLVMAKG